MDRIDLAKEIWKDWENGLAYQKKLHLKETCEMCVDFAEGRQWAPPTERTKNLPRPVLNIIEFILNSKKSNILSAKIKMIYKPLVYVDSEDDEAVKGAESLTNFATNISKELKQEDLDNEAITDGLRKGTYIYHYFWDTEQKTGLARYAGGLNGQLVDLLNVVFANPRETDEQKQKWIILQSRENVKTLKEIAKKNGIKESEIELIQADEDSEKNYDTEEQEGEAYATVLTRYFRVNGEVYYTKTTKQVVIQPETPLTPNKESIELELDEDNRLNEDTDSLGVADKPVESGFKITLYPIAVGQHKDREGSIYGISEVEQLIAIQKSINFNYAMMLMASQNIGFPKIVTTPRALNGKSITNKPGEIITDYSPNFNGIKYLNPPAFSSTPMSVSDKLIELTRVFTGATEIASGEVLGANMSGSAIVALQSQAKVPVEDMQKKFWRVHSKIAKIWEQFFKAYYDFDTIYTVEGEDGTTTETFNGAEYRNMEFNTVIDVGAGSAYSESMSIALLEASLQRGDITFDEFIELYPDNAMPFKARLKQIRKKKLLPPEISEQIASNPQVLQYVTRILQQAQQPALQIMSNQGQ